MDCSNFRCITELKSEVSMYDNGPYAKFQKLSSRRKGAVFEKIFEELMISFGATLMKNKSSGHDRTFDINGKVVRFEVKGSFVWGNTLKNGSVKWQQIRDQDYDVIVCIMVLPTEIKFYCATKADIMQFVDRQIDGKWPYNQHRGNAVQSGTYFIQTPWESVPSVLQELTETSLDAF